MPQVVRKFARICVALSRLRLERTINDFLQLRGYRRIKFARWCWVFSYPAERIHSLKRRSSCEHFVKHYSEGINITAHIAAFAGQLLGRKIVREADRLRQICKRYSARSRLCCHAEVYELDFIVPANQDILWPQVSMSDSMVLHEFKHVTNAQGNIYGPFGWKSLLGCQKLAKSLSIKPSHHNVGTSPSFVSQDAQQAGTPKRLSDVLFALKAVSKDWISFSFRMRDFNKNCRLGLKVSTSED